MRINTNTIVVVIVITVVILLIAKRRNDNFTISDPNTGKECTIDEDCGGNSNFCYMGRCWRYWNGQPMPWSTCRNPYCTNSNPEMGCSASPGKCSPYCKCKLNRRLGTTIGENCFPKCGTPCSSNSDCPDGCPACSYGVCSSPNPQTYVP